MSLPESSSHYYVSIYGLSGAGVGIGIVSVLLWAGDVIQISSMGEKTIILGSVEAANDLLDVRGEW